MTKSILPLRRSAAWAAAGLLLALSMPAAAQTARSGSQADDRTSTRTDRADPDERVCVRTRLSGSRLMQEICRTRREWQAEEGEIPASISR